MAASEPGEARCVCFANARAITRAERGPMLERFANKVPHPAPNGLRAAT